MRPERTTCLECLAPLRATDHVYCRDCAAAISEMYDTHDSDPAEEEEDE